jgi:hypothetical protein
MLHEGEAEALQVGRRAQVAVQGARRRPRPPPELWRRRPAAVATGVAEGCQQALLDLYQRGWGRAGCRCPRAGRRGHEEGSGLRAGVTATEMRAHAPAPDTKGCRHGDDAGREQGAVQDEHPPRRSADSVKAIPCPSPGQFPEET